MEGEQETNIKSKQSHPITFHMVENCFLLGASINYKPATDCRMVATMGNHLPHVQTGHDSSRHGWPLICPCLNQCTYNAAKTLLSISLIYRNNGNMIYFMQNVKYIHTIYIYLFALILKFHWLGLCWLLNLACVCSHHQHS